MMVNQEQEQEQELEQNVLCIIAAICKRAAHAIQLHDSLIDDLGIDSIQFLELLAELEEKFLFELDVDDLRPELFRSVNSVIRFVKNQVKAR